LSWKPLKNKHTKKKHIKTHENSTPQKTGTTNNYRI
jgi:hypothetical protein